MNATRDRIDLGPIERLYGKVKRVAVRELFYTAVPGYSGPEGWALLHKPVSVEEAARTIATSFGLVVTTADGREVCPDFRREELVKPRFDRSKPRTYLYGRLMLQFLADRDTPVMVAYRHGNRRIDTAFGTWHCVMGECDVDGHELTEKAREWLSGFEDEVEDWFELYGQGPRE